MSICTVTAAGTKKLTCNMLQRGIAAPACWHSAVVSSTVLASHLATVSMADSGRLVSQGMLRLPVRPASVTCAALPVLHSTRSASDAAQIAERVRQYTTSKDQCSHANCALEASQAACALEH